MDKKSPSEVAHRRSPFLCCFGPLSGPFIKTSLFSAIFFLCLAALVLVLIGALIASGISAFFFVSATLFLSGAAMLSLFYIWKIRRRMRHMLYPSKIPTSKTEISTLSGLDYYNQVPSGCKSDFPMGPYLVMTLPRTNEYRPRSGTIETENSSTCNTPKISKKNAARRAKNLPPLASAETLTPSLISSCYGSIDSVV